MSDDRPDGPIEAERAKAEQVENNARTVIDDLRAGRVRVGTALDVKQAVDRAPFRTRRSR